MVEITLQGKVDAGWIEWFGVSPTHIYTILPEPGAGDPCITVLSGICLDQTGVIGLLRRLHHVGVTLLSVKIEPDAA